MEVRRIIQKDNFTFSIDWSDGSVGHYRLSELQKRCPCAACVDEVTGKRRVKEENIHPDVRAVRIVNVGRYALRVEFTSGCSAGIYSFNSLYQMFKRGEV